MKKTLVLLILPLSLSLAGCDLDSTGTSEDSAGRVVSLTEEDKVKPTSTNLDYVDYGDNSNNSFSYDESKFYRNDLEIHLPDPAIYYEDGIYYVYGTTDRTSATSFDCYTTTDFNTYEPHYGVFEPSSSSWGNSSLFAPELYKFDDTYYLYYSAKNSATNSDSAIMIATASSPLGPFKEYQGYDADGNYLNGVTGGMIFDVDRGTISILDQTLLIDGDDIYMYYSIYDTSVMQYIVGVKMKDPVTPDWDTYQILLRPGALSASNAYDKTLSWECFQDFRVAEGPQVTKMPDGRYMMSYSVNHYTDLYYSVCYAISDTPLGTYEKPYEVGGYWTNILFGYAGTKIGTTYDQWSGFMGGTAHHFIFKVGEQYMIAYHAWANRTSISGGRAIAIDYLFFDEESNPYVHGPSYSIMPLPSEISGYENIALKAAIGAENVTYPERLIDNYIVEHYNLDAEQDKEALLKEGGAYIKLEFDQEYYIGAILIFNSAFYEYAVMEVDYIKFGNDNNIIDGLFLKDHISDRKEFVNPCSNFAFTFDDIVSSEVVISFNPRYDFQLNEIMVLGYAL